MSNEEPAGGRTVLVLGDQCNRAIGALAMAVPGRDTVLIIEAADKIGGRPWHVRRLHFYVSSMRHFVADLRAEGFSVDHRRATTMRAGVEAHRAENPGCRVTATAPNSRRARRLLETLDVPMTASNQFLVAPEDFAAWAAGRKSLRMEDFYREQRVRLGYLMEDGEPAGGRWNHDKDNRQGPPRGAVPWPAAPGGEMDDIDRAVLADLPAGCIGGAPDGLWATSRAGALERLRHFVENVLPHFGPHEDAMMTNDWHLAHSLLSPYLNNGLLLPGEVCDAVQRAWESGRVPVSSAEGFIRQVIGWREYVHGLYWLLGEDYAGLNELDATRPLPPVFRDPARTSMACVASAVAAVHERGWAHHIQRLMIMGNLALLAGVRPDELTDWMWEMFVDGAEWVMVPNVVGMALHADGGRMATKPYAAGGAYIDKMSDHCRGCAYDRRKRTGDDACPFTTLYWDFLLRHADRFARNHRMTTQIGGARKLADAAEVRIRARTVLDRLDAGTL